MHLLEIKAALQRPSYQHKRAVKGGWANHYLLSERNIFPALGNINEKLTIPMLCFFFSLGLDRLSHSMRSSAIIFLAGAEKLYSLLISLLCLPLEPWSSFISSCKPQASFCCRRYLSSEPDSYPGLSYHLVAGKVSRRRSESRGLPKYFRTVESV